MLSDVERDIFSFVPTNCITVYYLPDMTGVTAGTSGCNTRSESHNNVGCTANKSVPVLQYRSTTMTGKVG